MFCNTQHIIKVRCGLKYPSSNKKTIGRSLQAQVPHILEQKKKRAFCFATCWRDKAGSVTIEASLLVPVFLCAICSILMIGQLIICEAEIQYATAQTARICAKRTAISSLYKQASDNHGSTKSLDDTNSSENAKSSGYLYPGMKSQLSALKGKVEAKTVFLSVFDNISICKNCIVGGRSGIWLGESKVPDTEGNVTIVAAYILKIPVPFFRTFGFHKRFQLKQRIFSGYVEHDGEESADDPIVYIAENASVYHTSMSCSHICLHITSGNAIKGILNGSFLKPCEKCIKKGVTPSAIYITTYGDCYHSSLTCSGLKRTIKAVHLSEVKGMRMCSRCASK